MGPCRFGMPVIALDLPLGDSPDGSWIVARCGYIYRVTAPQMKPEQRLQRRSGLRHCAADVLVQVSRQRRTAVLSRLTLTPFRI